MQFDTLSEALHWAEQAFIDAGLYFGHGTDNAWDDAVALTLYKLDLPIDADTDILERQLSFEESQQLFDLYRNRIQQHIPVPYVTQRAWFCGLPFYIDQRVIIPRSPIAELISNQFSPWINVEKVSNILDLCCGSACIAIACAHVFPEARVDASELSTEAIEVANINVKQHEMEQRVHVLQSDLFSNIDQRRYNIIVSNPPYVDANDFASMPKEFQHEPELALISGQDGLDITRKILANASQYLTDDGILIVEVGNSAEALQQLFPNVAFTWLEFERGGQGVFLLTAQQLKEYQHVFS